METNFLNDDLVNVPLFLQYHNLDVTSQLLLEQHFVQILRIRELLPEKKLNIFIIIILDF